MPVEIRAGAHMRWLASALAVPESRTDTVVVGSFERAATFTVAP